MNSTANQKKGVLLMCICASMWSLGGLFIKLLPWNALVVAGWRSLIAVGCIVIYMLVTHTKLRINRNSLLTGLFLALLMISFVGANKLTSAANAIVLQFISPVFILLLNALFYRQRPLRADMITVALTVGGIALFFFDQLDPGGMMGNLLAIFAGFCMALMFLFTGQGDMESRMSGLLIGQLLTAAVGVPFSFVFDTPITTGAVASILILGIAQLGVPYIIYAHAVKSCPPLACSLLGVLEPLLNPIWVFLVTKEAPGVFALIGGVVIVTTITVWCVHRDRLVAAQAPAD